MRIGGQSSKLADAGWRPMADADASTASKSRYWYFWPGQNRYFCTGLRIQNFLVEWDDTLKTSKVFTLVP
jgi:hypothetical protein